ncbi:MAG: periplasmic heavy metal sensor [Syntrophaceae bacterium]|nr:periplasmic heavy metal sensor [Syntrophaceae bacterium]
MKNRWILLGLIVSVAFNFAFLGALTYRLIERRERREHIVHKIVKGKGFPHELMELSPDQEVCLQEIREVFHPEIKKIRGKLHNERKKLGDLLRQEPPDTQLMDKQLERIGQLQNQIERAVFHQLLKEKALLDSAQQEDYICIIEDRLGVHPEPRMYRKKIIKHCEPIKK